MRKGASFAYFLMQSKRSPEDRALPATRLAVFALSAGLAGLGGVEAAGDPLPPATIASIRRRGWSWTAGMTKAYGFSVTPLRHEL